MKNGVRFQKRFDLQVNYLQILLNEYKFDRRN